MRAVMSPVPPEILAWRRRTGADRWDEMWEGVLHMGPAPNGDHQELEGALEHYLRSHWCARVQGRVQHQRNVSPLAEGWQQNYRIPDLVLVTPASRGIDRNEFFEGAPSAVVEIKSPDDETYEKLPFYAALGVPEVWVIDGNSKELELFTLREGRYEKVAADAAGWIRSSATGVCLRSCPAGEHPAGEQGGKLELRVGDDASTCATLP
ncbi:MAG: Uma2 family endonuclease [Planctomycetota bacterium]